MLPCSQLYKTRYKFGRLLVTTGPRSKPSSLVEELSSTSGIYVLLCKTLVHVSDFPKFSGGACPITPSRTQSRKGSSLDQNADTASVNGFSWLRACIFTSSIHPFIYLVIHSFVHPNIHQFIHPSSIQPIHPSIHPSIHSFIHSFIHSLIHSFIQSFIHLIIHSVSQSFIHSFIHSLICLFIHLFSFTFRPSFSHLSFHKFICSFCSFIYSFQL